MAAVSIHTKGSTATRLHRCLAMAKDSGFLGAEQIAAAEYGAGSPVALILRAATQSGSLKPDETWGGDALGALNLAMSELWGLVREQAIIGRIASLRRVPENVRLAGIVAGATASWVGELKPKPFSALALEGQSLPHRKSLAQIVVTEELVRMGGPEGERLLRAELIRCVAEHLDASFVDPALAEVADVSPASVTNGQAEIASTGDPAADLAALVAAFDGDLAASYLVTHPTNAAQIALARDSSGGFMFPDAGPRGGSLIGMPLLTSRAVPLTTDGGIIALIDGSGIAFAGGAIELETARHASIQMDTAPDDPQTASTVSVNLWQRNLSALRAEVSVNWKTLRAGSVAFVSGVDY